MYNETELSDEFRADMRKSKYNTEEQNMAVIEELIRESGMELLAVYDAYTGKPASKNSERLFFIAKEKGKQKTR